MKKFTTAKNITELETSEEKELRKADKKLEIKYKRRQKEKLNWKLAREESK